jgi:hypothetical protein
MQCSSAHLGTTDAHIEETKGKLLLLFYQWTLYLLDALAHSKEFVSFPVLKQLVFSSFSKINYETPNALVEDYYYSI